MGYQTMALNKTGYAETSTLYAVLLDGAFIQLRLKQGNLGSNDLSNKSECRPVCWLFI